MSPKTDLREFAPGFIWQLALLSFLVLCFAIYSRSQEYSKLRYGVESPTSIFPWMAGGKQTLQNGLRAFSGKPPESAPIDDQVRALGPLLITLVLCPTIFFLEWRRRRLAEAPHLQQAPLSISGSLYALCGMVTVVVAVAVGPIAYFGEKSRVEIRHTHAVQSNRDLMINELNILAVDAAQYYILPKRLGGGGQSFEGYSVSENHAKSEEALYTVTVVRQTATFHATSATYASCSIDVSVDSLGHMTGWKYEGEFR